MVGRTKISNFSEFWPYYLGEHSKPATRWVHVLGTLAGLALALWALASGRVWFILAAIALGYAPAWIAHFFIEKNKPATLHYPFWSFCADFKMAFLLLTGKLERPRGK
ncbi:MAG TPA: DUF962 domain-containing protein [bacterium]|nr:DUF962 domain-containing protein [bacterium]